MRLEQLSKLLFDNNYYLNRLPELVLLTNPLGVRIYGKPVYVSPSLAVKGRVFHHLFNGQKSTRASELSNALDQVLLVSSQLLRGQTRSLDLETMGFRDDIDYHIGLSRELI